MSAHPQTIAEQLARQLQSDPVAAAQIKEFIKPDDLCRLLGLTLPEAEVEARVEAARKEGYNEGYGHGYDDADCK